MVLDGAAQWPHANSSHDNAAPNNRADTYVHSNFHGDPHNAVLSRVPPGPPPLPPGPPPVRPSRWDAAPAPPPAQAPPLRKSWIRPRAPPRAQLTPDLLKEVRAFVDIGF